MEPNLEVADYSFLNEIINFTPPTNLRNNSTSKIDINLYHNMLGHVGNHLLQKTALRFGINLTGSKSNCFDCAEAKSKQKYLRKLCKNPNSSIGEQLFMDISSVKGQIYGNKRYWNLLVDENSDMMWSTFLSKKSDLSYNLTTGSRVNQPTPSECQIFENMREYLQFWSFLKHNLIIL